MDDLHGDIPLEPSNAAHAPEKHRRHPARSDRQQKLVATNPLWELGGMSSIVIPMPFSKFGLLYVASGYVGDQVRPVFAIRRRSCSNVRPKSTAWTTSSAARSFVR
jgi:hypothetical protein